MSSDILGVIVGFLFGASAGLGAMSLVLSWLLRQSMKDMAAIARGQETSDGDDPGDGEEHPQAPQTLHVVGRAA